MDRLELEELGYRFEVSEFQCTVRYRNTTGVTKVFTHYSTPYFESWPNPRPLPKVWGLALAEAQRDFVARRLSV